MSDDPIHKMEKQIGYVQDEEKAGDIPPESADAILEWADAVDENNRRYNHKDGDTFAPSSICNYLQGLRMFCKRSNKCLTTVSAEEYNNILADMDDGTNDHVPDNGISGSTLKVYQSAAKSFYRHHHDFEIDAENIEVYTYTSDPRHDERDLFTDDDIQAMRNACGSPRDRALLETFIHTGQRLRAVQTLRIRDVDVSGDTGYIYLNDDAGGLKGATRRGKKRPVFGAKKYLRDWLEYHPKSKNQNWYVFIPDLTNNMVDESKNSHLQGSSIHRILKEIVKDAGVNKAPNPHNFRHYWVTIMSREYGLSNDNIKMLMGATKNSTVMNSVYKHITAEDYIEEAEVATGHKKESSNKSLTPETCPVCDEILQSNWSACPSCGQVLSPELEIEKGNLEDDMWERKSEVEPGSDEEEALDALKDYLKENPEAVEELID